MTPVDILCRRYADIFVARFDSLASSWSEGDGIGDRPWMAAGAAPVQNVSGTAYQGVNRLMLTLQATAAGYSTPLWLTFNQAREMGVSVLKGAQSMPVAFFATDYREKGTGKRAALTDEEYSRLSREEQDRYSKHCTVKYFSVFNLDQTDFEERYPETAAALLERLGSSRALTCDVLDRMVEDGTWLCPVKVSGDARRPSYDESSDTVTMPHASLYRDRKAWYSDLLKMMARSTGSEFRFDRSADCATLSGRAREELVVELSSAVLCTMCGLEATISESNLAHLKTWSRCMSDDPRVIFTALLDSSRAVGLAERTLGLEKVRGLDLCSVLSAVDRAEREKKERRERGESESRSLGRRAPRLVEVTETTTVIKHSR